MLCAGRAINGFAVGIESAQVPVYIAEISPPSKRGRFIAFQQWAITWGILIMYYISYGCSHIGEQTASGYNTTSWRLPWGLQIIPAAILFGMMILLPESPRWYARNDRWEDCHRVLTLVHGKGDPNHPFVQLELQDIKDMCEFERRNADVKYFDLFAPRMIHRTVTALFMQIWSQLTGMNVQSKILSHPFLTWSSRRYPVLTTTTTVYYIANVFSMAGYSGNANLVASSITYVINVVMTVPTIIYGDRWGRRPLLLIGSFLMMSFMLINGVILATRARIVPGGIDGVAAQSMELTGAPAKALIACTYLFVAS